MMDLLGLAGVWEFWGIVRKVSPSIPCREHRSSDERADETSERFMGMIAACGCLHGTCTSGDTCECSAGWTDADGKKCSVCAAGFFLSEEGDCQGESA
jgi:hypothetical protein